MQTMMDCQGIDLFEHCIETEFLRLFYFVPMSFGTRFGGHSL